MSMNHTQPDLLQYKVFTPEYLDAQEQIPLLILHGLLGSMDNWRSQAQQLATKRPVITMDLRNHGNSPHLSGMSYREMYEDVIKVARHLQIDKFDLLGHSMGGKVAMQMALAQEEIQDINVNRLIVVDIAPRPYPLWHQQTLQAIMQAPVETMESRQVINDFLEDSIPDQTERNFMIKNLRRANSSDDSGKGFRWKVNLAEITKNYLKIAGFSTAQQTYTNEALFIRGENSPYIKEQDYPLIQALFPNSTILSIENSGHLPHFEQVDEFFHQVDTFLSPIQ